MTQTIVWTERKVKTADLVPASYNPRKISKKEREELTKSIEQFGRVEPVIVNTGSRANHVIGGHQRIKIYADLGITEIEAKLPSRELTEVEEKELNLRLNKNQGTWDEELLKGFDIDMLLGVGFEDYELQSIFDDIEVIDDEFDVEKAIKETITPKVAIGEILVHGHSRER
jgi:site-specific DNA-methyltransferase (adenine-specific)